MPVVGFLSVLSPEERHVPVGRFPPRLLTRPATSRVRTLRSTIAWRGRLDRLPELAADLVRRQVAVIAAAGNAVAVAAEAATQTIPIVFTITARPGQTGLVASLARPGGNATGVNFFAPDLTQSVWDCCSELVPASPVLPCSCNPINAPNTSSTLKEVEPAARALGLQIQIFHASTGLEIDAAFACLVPMRPDALFVAPDGFFIQPADSNCRAGCAPRAASELFGA